MWSSQDPHPGGDDPQVEEDITTAEALPNEREV